jgi:hypothetical protein
MLKLYSLSILILSYRYLATKKREIFKYSHFDITCLVHKK